MTSARCRVVALGLMVLAVVLLAGCDRPAAADPLGTPAGQAQAADATTAPAEFPTATPTTAGVLINPTAAPTIAVAQVTPVATTPAPTATTAPTTPTSTPVPGAGTTYVVKAGDRLFSIGRQFGVNPYSIAQANDIKPPYIIHPGDTLKIPSGGTGVTPLPGGKTHVVAPGENLFRIALKYGTTYQALAAANGITNPNLIFVGQVLKIP